MASQKSRRGWRIAGHVVTIVFVVLVAWLLVTKARTIDWDEVRAAIRGYAGPRLALAGLLAALSYALYAGYEFLGRAYTRHRLPRPQVAAIAFVSYAFNLNLSAWIGGIGFRYRLYMRRGLAVGTVTRILGVGMVTNWLGYLCLAGAAFALGLVPLPEGWKIGAGALRTIGVALLGVAAAYVWLCAYSRRRVFRIRSAEVRLPPLPMALTQLMLSMANWMAIAGILFTLLHPHASYDAVLAVLLIAAIAGVISHIPAGLGVVEAVFFALLGGTVPSGALLAALFAYRAIYYLVPLAAAVMVYAILEARAKAHRATLGHAR